MLILLFLIIAVVFLAIAVKRVDTDRVAWLVSCIVLILCIGAIVILGGNIVSSRITSKADAEGLQEVYLSLYNQASMRMYENDNDFGKKQLADQITKWNKQLVEYRAKKNNIFTSDFYPINVDDLKTIPITLLEGSVG